MLPGGAVAGQRYIATQLGSAVLSSALSPDEGLAVFAELQKARRCFVLENELHVIYLVDIGGARHPSGSYGWCTSSIW